jgi:hypothetical protein
MAASDARSSARVAPRSVSRLVRTSSSTSALVVAVDSTAPVHEPSPTVRYRTVRARTRSPLRGPPHGPVASHMPSRGNTSRVCA